MSRASHPLGRHAPRPGLTAGPRSASCRPRWMCTSTCSRAGRQVLSRWSYDRQRSWPGALQHTRTRQVSIRHPHGVAEPARPACSPHRLRVVRVDVEEVHARIACARGARAPRRPPQSGWTGPPRRSACGRPGERPTRAAAGTPPQQQRHRQCWHGPAAKRDCLSGVKSSRLTYASRPSMRVPATRQRGPPAETLLNLRLGVLDRSIADATARIPEADGVIVASGGQ